MSFNEEIKKVEHSKLSSDEKIKQLNQIILDLTNEMEAEDQNMHPEVNHDLAIKLQEASDILRKIEDEAPDMSTGEICKKIMNDNTTRDNLGNSPEVNDIKDICRTPKK